MKFNKEPRELGDWYEPEVTLTYTLTLVAVVVGTVVLFLEFSGLADYIINSFN